jgi:hypothetical protein
MKYAVEMGSGAVILSHVYGCVTNNNGYWTPFWSGRRLASDLRLNSILSLSLYVTTDGQSPSLSWNKAPIWGLRPDLYYCLTVAGFLMWDALSDERTGLSFTISAGPRQRSHSRVRIQMGLANIFYCLRFETSFFVASYDSQGHGGGIRPHLHTE